ncbi:hypothetical protein [Desulfobotulus mexicanus]|uniref:hypothetical protein n=1 Tax=Desulfobotulus mexicanus TaxID=2586642 RepID=UPI0015D2FFFA|nr:hypothetical protein [Desulfobotulus mexicanus]
MKFFPRTLTGGSESLSHREKPPKPLAEVLEARGAYGEVAGADHPGGKNEIPLWNF